MVREQFPALATMEAAVANIRVRSAGTIGGNLCFAEPHSDPATLLTALDAQLTLTSASGTRQSADGLVHHRSDGNRPPPRRDSGDASTCRSRRSNAGVAYERFKLHERPTAAVAAVIAVDRRRD